VSERRVYLDLNASTPLAPEVVAALEPLLREHYGNPSSDHWAGRTARHIVEDARADVAALLNAAPQQIVVTSGGTEANNAATGILFKRAGLGAACRLARRCRLHGLGVSRGDDVDVAGVDGNGCSARGRLGAVRFSLGRTTTQDELEYVVAQLISCRE
jgi:cysteine sulfinate desulfinase/cysteine desulfurase-like protein